MAFFQFKITNPESHDDKDFAGAVSSVDTRKIIIDVPDGCLERISVGKLAVLHIGNLDEWLVGFIDRVTCASLNSDSDTDCSDDIPAGSEAEPIKELTQRNVVYITLAGTIRLGDQGHRFTRSLTSLPDIQAPCFVLRGNELKVFMSLLSKSGDTEHALKIGKYSLDTDAIAYLDGDKFFQRHAALLGSTGSGKSWAVATILERAAKLPSANLLVFDLHGEYNQLSYASQLRIPGPDELELVSDNLLFLPYWLMNAEELTAFFVDISEFTAHNQTMVLQREIEKAKLDFLTQNDKPDIISALTVDSPVPFTLNSVVKTIEELNTEMVQGARGLKQGDFYGQFSRFLARIERKCNDKRYGFLFQSPEQYNSYSALYGIAKQLLDFSNDKTKIKVIDFSEVPSDALPVMLGIVARLVYNLQFWMPGNIRQPVALVCDEAHIYLPHDKGNPNETRAVECFEKIAKEGRKYGVALLVVSQRPSDVNATILSQCNNVIALRLTNAVDQNVVNKLMPESLSSLLEVLPILDVGEALAVGDAVLLPSRIQVNIPAEKPNSATIDFWTEWSKTGKNPDWELASENMRRQRRRDS
jgi:hypothetical protein